MKLGKDVFTTGQVAKLLAVSVRTVCGWADRGMFGPGDYRIPSGLGTVGSPRDEKPNSGGDRRIPVECLIRFADRAGMGTIIRRALCKSLILVDVSPVLESHLHEHCLGLNIVRAGGLFAAGSESASHKCGIVIADCSGLGRWSVLNSLYGNNNLLWGWIVMLAEDDSNGSEAFTEAGAVGVVSQPADKDVVVAHVLRWLGSL